MIITLKDGSQKEYEQSMSVYDIARDISEGLARAACAGEVDGEVVDLRTVVDGCEKKSSGNQLCIVSGYWTCKLLFPSAGNRMG